MRIVLVLLATAAVLGAGCITTPPTDDVEAASADAAATAPEPVIQEFHGVMTASVLAAPAHQNAELEMMIAPVQREGFILDVVEVPDVLQVDLEWTATTPDAQLVSMVNIPTSTEGEVLDVFSEWTDSGSVCMRLPLDEIQPGPLSVMAHSMDAVNVEYVIRITSIGGEVVLHADRGHMEVEREDGEERDALPCPAAAEA